MYISIEVLESIRIKAYEDDWDIDMLIHAIEVEGLKNDDE